jgi:hypothetical protein
MASEPSFLTTVAVVPVTYIARRRLADPLEKIRNGRVHIENPAAQIRRNLHAEVRKAVPGRIPFLAILAEVESVAMPACDTASGLESSRR